MKNYIVPYGQIYLFDGRFQFPPTSNISLLKRLAWEIKELSKILAKSLILEDIKKDKYLSEMIKKFLFYGKKDAIRRKNKRCSQ